MEAHNSKTRLGTSEVPLVVKFADAKRKDPTPHHVSPPFTCESIQQHFCPAVNLPRPLVVPLKKDHSEKVFLGCQEQSGKLTPVVLICRCRCMAGGWADHWGLGI